MTHPESSPLPDDARDDLHDDDASELDAADAAPGHDEHQPPHPPFARSPEEYTDPPGHHRRGPNGPALDVGG
jgi:hypothetical protein